jgi:dynein heavy chain
MGAVMTYLGEGTEWSQIKKTMGDSQFMKRIIDFDMENIKKSTMEAISKYTSKEDFTVANMTKKSAMAGVLCGWVRAVEEYFKAY